VVPTLPDPAAVTMPLGWPEPVPVVKCVLVIRPRRVTRREVTNASMSTALSCSSSIGTATDFELYL
jgi:hypothetical protein